MGKAHKKAKASSGDKKAAFWQAVESQKLKDLRGGLTNTATEAHTRNAEQLTSIMLSAATGKAKSLDCLLDWYERRKVLRPKGWINLRDDNGVTALMMAAANGHTACVENLLDKGALVMLKDEGGHTARDFAVKRKKHKVVEAIDYFLSEPEEEEEGEDGAINDGLTSTQRSRLKKRALLAAEGRGGLEGEGAMAVPVGDQVAAVQKRVEAREAALQDAPKATWPEVKVVVESVKLMRPVTQITVLRNAEFPLEAHVAAKHGGIDPAIWYLSTVNRMSLQLPKGVLVALPGPSLLKMSALQTLILSNNSLADLPTELGQLSEIKVLEIGGNCLTALPACVSELRKLELLNVAGNAIESVAAAQLGALSCLSTLNLNDNKLQGPLDLPFETLSRLHNLSASNNAITELPAGVGSLALLNYLVMEGNAIVALPVELAQLKKIKELKFGGNPIKDQKVVKMLNKAGSGLKDLWKYLPKNAARSAAKSGGGGKKGKKKAAAKAAEEAEVSALRLAQELAKANVSAAAASPAADDGDDDLDLDFDDL